MAGADRVLMSTKELKRVQVIQQALGKKIKQVEAAQVLGLSDRQIRRLVKRVEAEGERGLVHRSQGRCSNRAIDGRIKARILKLYEARYSDFGPTLAAEKLAERNGIAVSDETLRLWLLQAGITHFKRRARRHRRWRERKRHAGQMIQMDGSHHDWLEGRGPACVLMGYIDDATGRVFARFYAYEGTIPAMDSFQRYARRYGLPMSVYLDQHSTYKSTAKPTIEEQLQGLKPMSQFERALGELGVQVLHANSPQAKGRIERLFGTFQDRLIKEMRLAGIQTIDEANRFLQGYLPTYNRRFSVKPVEAVDLHRPSPASRDLEGILCLKAQRVLRNDFTVAYHGKLYQIEEANRAKQVSLEERLDGTLRITHRGKPLRYREIQTRPIRLQEPVEKKRISQTSQPPSEHPWRRSLLHNHEEWKESMNEKTGHF
jgi:transposase